MEYSGAKWRKGSDAEVGGARCSSGTYTPKLDEKGRLFLPAKFRDQLAEGLVVTEGRTLSRRSGRMADFASHDRPRPGGTAHRQERA